MVLDTKNTTLAYRCPQCGAAVFSGVNVFSLSADMLKLKCTCGKSEMSIVNGKDAKIRLSVPCLLCRTPHQFTLSRSLFFDKELFCMPCPYTDITLCAVGEENHVKAEMSRSELELMDLLEQNGLTEPCELGEMGLPAEERFPTDPQIRDIVMFVIRDLDEEGKIRCHCEPGADKRFDVEILDDGIRVSCCRCEATRLIPTDSGLSAHAFLNSDHLDLTVEQE